MTKKLFIAFAVEDRTYRDFVSDQSKHRKTPVEFPNLEPKQPWSPQWKTNCRTLVKGCDGMIALISHHTPKAEGQLWEIQCAVDERVPLMLMWVNGQRPQLPDLLKTKRINIWNWDTLHSFVQCICAPPAHAGWMPARNSGVLASSHRALLPEPAEA